MLRQVASRRSHGMWCSRPVRLPQAVAQLAFLGLAPAVRVAFPGARGPAAYRGRGLAVDTLPVNDVVRIYRAALAGSFTLSDPALSLLLDPTLLPRGEG